jgi:hypothetical protein
MAALTVVPSPASSAVSLYAIQESLAALADSEALVPAEEQEAFAAELRATRTAAAAKVDAVSRFLAHVESQAQLAAAEIAALQKRKALYERASRRVKALILRTVQALGRDTKGKWQRLEGNTSTLAIKGCTQAVEISDEAAVPLRFKRTTVTMPAELWERLVDSLPMGLACDVMDAARPRVEVSLSAVKAAIDAKETVPGAELGGGYYVARK